MLRQHKNSAITQRVGLDVGTHTIKGVEVVDRAAETVIRSAGAVALPRGRDKHEAPEHAAIVQAIKSLWASANFESKRVVLALPADAAYIKWLHLEAANTEDLDMTARSAAIRGAPFSADEAIVDYRVLSSRGAASRNVHFVMLLAAKASAVDALLNAVEAAGLEPLAVDISTPAALRSFQTQKRAASPLWGGQPLAHCIVGARNTTITVVRNGDLEFARTVPVGGNDFTECIAEHCNTGWSEAEKSKMTPGTRLLEGGVMLTSHNKEEVRVPCEHVLGRLAREIQRSLRFFSSQFAEGSYLGMIGAATMSGGGALLKGLDMCLQNEGIDVTGTVNPFAGLSVDSDGGVQQVSEAASQYSAAVGLAIGDYWTGGGVTPIEVAA